MLSSDPWLGTKPASQKLQLNQSWTILVRSTWHGPDRDGKMAVELLASNQPACMPRLARQQTVAALQGPDACTDVQIAEFIRSWTGDLGGLLPALLLAPPAAAAARGAGNNGHEDVAPDQELPSSPSAAAGAGAAGRGVHAGGAAVQIGSLSPSAAAVVAHFGLNPGQAEVVAHISRWQPQLQHSTALGGRRTFKLKLQKAGGDAQAGLVARLAAGQQGGVRVPGEVSHPAGGPVDGGAIAGVAAGGCLIAASPVCLIHGPFGSGKSTLLVALIHLLVGWAVIGEQQQVQEQQQQLELKAQQQQQQEPLGREKKHHASPENLLEDEDAGQIPGVSSGRVGGEQNGKHKKAKRQMVVSEEDAASSDEEFEGFNQANKKRRCAHVVVLDESSDEDGDPGGGGQLKEGGTDADIGSRQQGGLGNKGINPPDSSSKEVVGMDMDPFEGEVAAAAAEPAAAPACQGPSKGGKQAKACKLSAAGRGTKAKGPACRVLVAAHTNVAVDRVLLGLLDSGFTDILRVGSLQRIAKPLLQYSLHSADDSKDAIAQLNAMLHDATGRDAEMIR